ncbi:MAG: efflux transporter outer membrane subunit [Rickettsiales bacterium]
MRHLPATFLLLFALTACDLSPDFTLPSFDIPAQFKEQPAAADASEPIAPITDGKWKRFDEKARLDETAWWKIFNDPTLDALEEQALADSPTLDAALARVTSARAATDTAFADLFPAISIGAGPLRQKPAVANINGSFPAAAVPNIKPYTLYQVRGEVTYDLDLFGKTRNNIRDAEFGADAEQQRYVAARLALQADVAQAYFAYAAAARELVVVKQSVEAQSKNLNLTRKKRDVGEIDDLAVGAQETEFATAQQSAAQLEQSKAIQEHRLALLLGKTPATFSMAKVKLPANLPKVPATLPSSLLERRPDVQAAAADIAAANARIGVARAGYFPDISLSASGGFTSNTVDDLFKWSSRTWALGPLAGTILTQPVFQGGRVAAAVAQRRADYQASVANYRQSVLQAFSEVEDQLSGLHHLGDEAKAAASARKTAAHAFDIAKARYEVGYSSYLEYLDAQRSLLAAERSEVQVQGNRFVTTVQLIRALGGRWDALPAAENAAAPATPPTPEPVSAPAAKSPATEPAKPAEPEAETQKSETENAAENAAPATPSIWSFDWLKLD